MKIFPFVSALESNKLQWFQNEALRKDPATLFIVAHSALTNMQLASLIHHIVNVMNVAAEVANTAFNFGKS